MTGTSMDGLDMIVADIKLQDLTLDYKIIASGFQSYPSNLRKNIENALDGKTADICKLNYEWGRWVASALRSFIDDKGIDGLELIGSHGQTLHHVPGISTLQIGETAFMAREFNVPVISDFRAADIAAGGSGAPIMPWVDKLLYGNKNKGSILLNIGGVANISILPPVNSKHPYLGFDTGPGMALLDEYFQMHFSESYDKEGRMASKGFIHHELLKKWLEHDFINQAAPKSTGRDIFGLSWLKMHNDELEKINIEDALTTLAAFTAATIAENCEKYLKDYKIAEMRISGGGVHHTLILSELKRLLNDISVEVLADKPLHPDMKEAFGMAVYACAHIQRIPVDLSSVTGATTRYIPGKCQWP